MAIVKPFRALRPKPELAAQVASPPYDVLDSDEARVMAEGNPLSFLHVVKPEIDLPPETDHYAPEVYAKGRENLDRLRAEAMMQDEKPCFYLYAQKMGTHRQFGLVAVASAEDYQKDVIKKHELTRADKEEDRVRHVDTLDANTGPVFLTYPAVAALDALADEVAATPPVADFVSPDGIGHTYWVIDDDAKIRAIEAEFAKMPCLYVADGHHRSASASRVYDKRKAAKGSCDGSEEWGYFLSVIFPHDQMQILDYNRVVIDLNGLSKEDFVARVEEKFTVEPTDTAKPAAKHRFGMYLDGRWHALVARPGSFPQGDPVRSLDVSILQENLLAPILGIGDPRTDERIKFVGGIRGMGELEKLVNSGKWAVAFSMFPTAIEDLMRIADVGKTMPPKSTWFEPKLRSGLFVHLLSE